MEINASTLVDNRYYTWALNPAQAVNLVRGYLGSLGQSAVGLTAQAVGVTRPQGYDHSVNDMGDGLVETSDESLRRYRIDVS